MILTNVLAVLVLLENLILGNVSVNKVILNPILKFKNKYLSALNVQILNVKPVLEIFSTFVPVVIKKLEKKMSRIFLVYVKMGMLNSMFLKLNAKVVLMEYIIYCLY